MITITELVNCVFDAAAERRDEELAALGLTWDEVLRLSNLNTAKYTASDRKKWRKFEVWYADLKARNAELLAALGYEPEKI